MTEPAAAEPADNRNALKQPDIFARLTSAWCARLRLQRFPFPWELSLESWLVVLVAVGVGWRLTRYLVRMPIWGDEASLCVNFFGSSYHRLMGPLSDNQVSPLLFLWSEFTVFKLGGGSELWLRLLPLAAGIAALFCYIRLVRLWCAEIPHGKACVVLASAILAVASYPVRHSCEIKPYSADLLIAILLLWGGTLCLQPGRWWPRSLLLVLLPFALAFSFPAAFVAGGLVLALTPGTIKRRRFGEWLWLAAFAAVLLAVSVMLYAHSEHAQFGAVRPEMMRYWQHAFPPRSPLKFLEWLLAVHTGTMMAYPFGGKHAGSILTAGLFATGLWCFVRERRFTLIAVLMAPFVLTFAAAVVHRYPYGQSDRVSQHLAPAICFLAAVGIVTLADRLTRDALSYRRTLSAVCLGLALFGTGGLLRDLSRPYKTIGDVKIRSLTTRFFAEARNADSLAVFDAPVTVPVNYRWYLGLHGARVRWSGQIDFARLRAARGNLWLLNFAPRPGLPRLIAARLSGAGLHYVLVEDYRDRFIIDPPNKPYFVELLRWAPWAKGVGGSNAGALNSSPPAHLPRPR